MCVCAGGGVLGASVVTTAWGHLTAHCGICWKEFFHQHDDLFNITPLPAGGLCSLRWWRQTDRVTPQRCLAFQTQPPRPPHTPHPAPKLGDCDWVSYSHVTMFMLTGTAVRLEKLCPVLFYITQTVLAVWMKTSNKWSKMYM